MAFAHMCAHRQTDSIRGNTAALDLVLVFRNLFTQGTELSPLRHCLQVLEAHSRGEEWL